MHGNHLRLPLKYEDGTAQDCLGKLAALRTVGLRLDMLGVDRRTGESIPIARENHHVLRVELLDHVRRMGCDDRLSHLLYHVLGHAPLDVRRKRDLRLFHHEDDRLVFLQIRDDRQQCEDQQINRAGALSGERHRMVAWLRRNEESDDLT